MLHIKFQASEPSSFEEEDFEYVFLPSESYLYNVLIYAVYGFVLVYCYANEIKFKPICISMVRTQDFLAQDNLGPWDLHLNKLGKRLLGNATFQI